MRLVLPYPPSGNLYWRHVRGRVLVSREARAYRVQAALMARAQGARPLAGPLAVTIEVYRPRRIGDLDNALKVLLDALRGIAFEDDSQVVDLAARRWDDPRKPRVEILVAVLAPRPEPKPRAKKSAPRRILAPTPAIYRPNFKGSTHPKEQ